MGIRKFRKIFIWFALIMIIENALHCHIKYCQWPEKFILLTSQLGVKGLSFYFVSKKVK